MTLMWRYFYATFTMFIIAPELRRVQDLLMGFSSIQILSILPYLMLIPFFYAAAANGRLQRLPRWLSVVSWLWVSGFVYGLILATINGNLASGLYTFMEFVFPLPVALWLATEQLPPGVAYARLSSYIFRLTTIICVYGIIQWVIVPPWDAVWINQLVSQGMLAVGTAQPFALRVFSTLNAPGVFANYVALVAILALPRLTLKRPWLVAEFVIWMLPFFMSLVRTAWIMLALGAIVYCVMTRRFKVMAYMVSIGMFLCISVSAIAPNSPLVTVISSRFSTMSDIQGDQSYNARSDLYVEKIPEIGHNPIGVGLGVYGTAAKISNGGDMIDSGIIARFLEMGWGGAAMLYGALFLCANFALDEFIIFESHRQYHRRDIFAVIMAIQIAMVFLDFSGESHLGLLGIMFWLPLAALSEPSQLLERGEVSAPAPGGNFISTKPAAT
jgi:putative inorganic carbon (HCO3(-)) transporter